MNAFKSDREARAFAELTAKKRSARWQMIGHWFAAATSFALAAAVASAGLVAGLRTSLGRHAGQVVFLGFALTVALIVLGFYDKEKAQNARTEYRELRSQLERGNDD